MPVTALVLVLLAALLHAAWNLVAKRAGGDHRFALLSAVLVTVLWSPVALWLGVDELPRWGPVEWAVVLASAVLHLLYFNVLLTGYRRADLTVVYPVARGSAPLLSALVAIVLLGEAATGGTVAGVLAVCGGVFVLAGGPALLGRRGDPAARSRTLAGVRWGALTGAFIAAYTVVDAVAVKRLLIAPVVLDYVGNVLRVPFLLPGAWRDKPAFREVVRTQWRAAAVVAVLGPQGYVMVLYAMKLAPLSHVAPAREVSMLFAALAGGRLLGEGDRAARLAGAACIGLGVALLALS